ncbi:hypothetical protein Sste5346_008553 [Sporothrix stenoceras]|uniref:ubiquitinyl hydrolase 1 n=1 Tax=Sporothrix stenoceras TaxID=5173 RepID=A0ABR3YNN0_9PEZI
MAFPVTLASLQKVFNHVVLPQQLPPGQDEGLEEIGYDIMRRVRHACGQLKATLGDDLLDTWIMVEDGISAFSNTIGSYQSTSSFLNAFQHLKKENNVLPLYLEEQNAALLMYLKDGNIFFEAFEAAPQTQDVLASPDALLWTFPSRAVQIPESDFGNSDFQKTLALFFDKAGSEHIAHLAAKARKAGTDVAEVRNPGSPALVTHMLLSLLQAMGGPAAVTPIKKRVRDDGSGALELRSALLLEIFDQWALLDQICVHLHPLLGDYSPMFRHNLLDVLQLPDIESMRRLRRVQSHIHQRAESSRWGAETVFSDGPHGFSTRFAEASLTHVSLYNDIMADQECLGKTVTWSMEHPPPNPQGPSSYEAVASRLECPADMSVHEFEAFQRLISGTSRRWLTMAVEMGSSNVDFSKEDAIAMFGHLAHQAGPMIPKSSGMTWPYNVSHANALGVMHSFFLDEHFVDRILVEIEKRLRGIERNWRETSTMGLLITLLLRTRTLVDKTQMETGKIDLLLLFARSTTLAWMESLRGEVMNAIDSQSSGRAAMYAFKAALLCRRTFTPRLDSDSDGLSADDLNTFLRASIAMQQNLTVDINTLPPRDQQLVVRDMVMAYRLRDKITRAAERHPESINEAAHRGIGLAHATGAEGMHSPASAFDEWVYLCDNSDGWILSILHPSSTGEHAQDGIAPQHIGLHLTLGYLLVNGKIIGRLPDHIRDSTDVKEVLGTRHFLTYPSAMPGMSHRIATIVEDHMIHLGEREGNVVILSIKRSGEAYEYVPRRNFIGQDNVYDLPRGLVDDCYHWLNRVSKQLEIRRNLTKWDLQQGDWTLDVRSRQAVRQGHILVDPLSEMAEIIRPIFHGFEDTQRLTIFQPAKPQEALSMELRHLELSFFVNHKGNLECRELGAEVDHNQDAGTLYGYHSMIVLRDISDPSYRSIIAPLGSLEWRRSGVHIDVQTQITLGAQSSDSEKSAGYTQVIKSYARFDIDTNLGRLTCAPEPRLLYTKAQLHAFTSYPIPDPLTGRTGEEEAFHTLLSGRLQPWVPLPDVCLRILDQMTRAIPAREYYPKNLRVLQKVKWSEHLPVGLQSDRYGRVLREIVAKAARLRRFDETVSGENKELDKVYGYWAELHGSDLETRGEIQRMRYECPREDSEPACPVQATDRIYLSLGCIDGLVSEVRDDIQCKASAVFQIAKTLRTKPSGIPMTRDISAILSNWAKFGGYKTVLEPDPLPISSLLNSRTVKEQWGSLVEMCRFSTTTDSPKILFTLSCLAFAPDADMDAVRLLAAYSYVPELQSCKPPVHVQYQDFSYNEELTQKKLKSIVATNFVDYVARDIKAIGRAAIEAAMRQESSRHDAMCQQEADRLAKELMLQWPEKRYPSMGDFESAYIKYGAAFEKICVLWTCLQNNRDLSRYLGEVEKAISKTRTIPARSTTPKIVTDGRPLPTACLHESGMPSLGLLAGRSFASTIVPVSGIVDLRRESSVSKNKSSYTEPKEYRELQDIIKPFEQSAEPMRHSYGRDLQASLEALKDLTRTTHTATGTTSTIQPTMDDAGLAVASAKDCLETALSQIQHSLSEVPPQGAEQIGFANRHKWLQRSGLWPRVTPVSVLELLRSSSNLKYGEGMKQALVRYAEHMISLQRCRRLLRALFKDDKRRLTEELANTGHTNWVAEDNPDWLLLEIDSNMLIREEQVTVAKAMISPDSNANSVFQLNMGKGKTSMILPMSLSILADKTQLARLLTPKALLLPTAQVLQSRLGGLVGREIRHVPFSRRLLARNDCTETVAMFKEHHTDLAKRQGILITAPEHVLAFTLSGQQCFVDATYPSLAVEMMEFDAHMRENFCRDVLDESDFTLAVRTQLVYPSGKFTAVDGAPFRWQLAQALLSLVEEHVAELAVNDPHRINVVKRPGGGFPAVHILHSSIDDELRKRLALDIVKGRLPFFRPVPKKKGAGLAQSPVKSQSIETIQQLLQRALASDSSDAAIDKAANLFSDVEATTSGLLLVRGLLKHDILTTCLKKRWNVHYGLHPKRWPIAVPFEARGVPSERSEFGHPDVAMIFTCLAFYYAGIGLEQFREGLNHILHHVDDPATEYEKWTSGDGSVTLPEELQHWNSINVDDEGQVEKLWKCLRFTRTVVNHYLNTFVFPVHSRQFSVKLQASAWDLPLFTLDSNSNTKDGPAGARTTGFSGTNDNKAMLPLSIKQHDLPGLQQTNAEVLSYLLQYRNRSYICTGGDGHRWSEQGLVTSLAKYQIQVFIDAGAYILEHTNEALARSWLKIADPKVKAAVYFDEKDNRAWVVFRDATAEKAPLVSTPFAERLDECIVYFDEAHTRGVDLLLPPKARGALTLALGQTKDHTVQAAMRLRQLGTTQSVVFYAPPEVDQSIRDICQLGNSVTRTFVDSSHVVSWLLEQTCQANEQLGPLYSSHGYDFCRRAEALAKHKKTLAKPESRKALLEVLEQPERQTLKIMYGNDPIETVHSLKRDEFSFPSLQSFAGQLRSYRSAGSGGSQAATAIKGAFEEVEQEREVEVQVQQQRSTQRRTKYTALKFPGHVAPSIREFVKTGILARNSKSYESVFDFLSDTDIGDRHDVCHIDTALFVSMEFRRTIDTAIYFKHRYDNFLRPVEWLLWSPSTETGLVIIPEELELLLPDIQKSKCTQLIAYAAPVTRSMLDFSSLKFYSFPTLPSNDKVPDWLPIELGILAGRLYMTYDEAMAMAKYLGQYVDDNDNDDKIKKEDDTPKQFCPNPTSFLLEWLPLRRTAQDVLHTPIAYVCQGRTLRPDHSFFLQPGVRQVEDVVKEEEEPQPKEEEKEHLIDFDGAEEEEEIDEGGVKVEQQVEAQPEEEDAMVFGK